MTQIARNSGPFRRPPAPGPADWPHRRETGLCLALSAALHFAALAAFATIAPTGESSGGSGGTVMVTLVGSDELLAAVAGSPPEPDRAPVAAVSELVAPPDETPPLTGPEPPPPPEAAVAVAPPAVPPGEATAAKPEQPAAEPSPRARPADLTPPPRATAAAEARVTSRAAGAGGAKEAGARGAAEVATGATVAPASAMQTWQAQIQRALQRGLRTPRGLDRAPRSLRVVLALSVAPDGRLRSAGIAQSSGDAALDAGVLRSVRRMGRLPRAPEGLTGAAHDFLAPIDLHVE